MDPRWRLAMTRAMIHMWCAARRGRDEAPDMTCAEQEINRVNGLATCQCDACRAYRDAFALVVSSGRPPVAGAAG